MRTTTTTDAEPAPSQDGRTPKSPRGVRGARFFAVLSGGMGLAAFVVGLLLLLNSSLAGPMLGTAALLERIGIQVRGEPGAWVGFFVIQYGAFEAILAVAFWQQKPWAYPFLVVNAAAPLVFMLAVAGPPWGGFAGGLIGAAALAQIGLGRYVRAQFAR